MLSFTEKLKPGTAVDVAMGQGRNALMLAERGWDVTGFDISDVAVAQAEAQAKARGVKIYPPKDFRYVRLAARKEPPK